MSQSSKRPGARDISDLKARLGLKKPGAGAAPAPGGVAPPPGAAVVPPPGASPIAGPGGAIPAPPGVAQAPPAAAFQQAPVAQPAPDIVIVNDGKPVENLAKQNKGGSLVKNIAMIALPLVAGVIVGKVASSAGQFNQVIEDAAPIRDDVKKVRSSLTDLQAVLQSGKDEKGNFKPGDEELTKKIADLPELTADFEQIYSSSLYTLETNAVVEIFGFYGDVSKLRNLITAHLKATKVESKILKEGVAKFAGFNPMLYGAVIDIPEGDEAAGSPVKFKIVQLGGPVCEGETRPNPQGCPGPMVGFGYRDDETSAAWQTSKLASPTEGVVTDTIVMLDPSSKTILQQRIEGGNATVAKAAYEARLQEIEAITERLQEQGKLVEKALNAKSNESKKFSFFL